MPERGHKEERIFTLADLALAAAANSRNTRFLFSSSITFLRASGPGDTLAEARERYIGREAPAAIQRYALTRTET